jgi:hypothetical protein
VKEAVVHEVAGDEDAGKRDQPVRDPAELAAQVAEEEQRVADVDHQIGGQREEHDQVGQPDGAAKAQPR